MSNICAKAPLMAPPFSLGKINQLFVLFGINDQADAVLDGTIDIENLNFSEEVKVWLYELACDNGKLSPTDLTITPKKSSEQ